MRVEPVYLLPPEPDRRVKMSRRAFAAGAAGLLGSGLLSGVCLARLGMEARPTGKGSAPQANGPAESSEAPVSDQLIWARKAAVGPIEQLVQRRWVFIAAYKNHAGEDDLVHAGGIRLSEHIIGQPESQARFNDANMMLNAIIHVGREERSADIVRSLRHITQR